MDGKASLLGIVNAMNPPTGEVLTGAAESLDYQMAFLLAASQYGAKALSLLGGAFAALGARHPGVGAPLDNQWDLAGAEMSAPSAYYMVTHAQYRYGREAQVFIEDQPLVRGQAFSSAVKASFADFAIRLLVDRYYYSDFGDDHSLVLIADRLNVDNARRKRRGGRYGDPTSHATNQTLWRKAA
ncbi:MAG: hypothetical protein JNM82_00055 [Rhodocyclaceae bacterium]|nr:hypothetical protein [Rhodocyclaceae bacterium]